jgi:hypothetical protein
MSLVVVLGAWVGGSIAVTVAGGWLAGRERRSAPPRRGMSRHAVEASLRPRGGHVEPSPIKAPHTTNGRRSG